MPQPTIYIDGKRRLLQRGTAMCRQLKRVVVLVAALLLLGLPTAHAAPSPQAAPKKPADVLDTVAAKLIEGMFGASPCAGEERRTMGLWIFEEDKIPISSTAAKTLHEELVSRIMAARPACIDMIDSRGIGLLIARLNDTGALAKNGARKPTSYQRVSSSASLLPAKPPTSGPTKASPESPSV